MIYSDRHRISERILSEQTFSRPGIIEHVKYNQRKALIERLIEDSEAVKFVVHDPKSEDGIRIRQTIGHPLNALYHRLFESDEIEIEAVLNTDDLK